MVSETHLRLISKRTGSTHEKIVKPRINIDEQKQLAIENITVWEIDNGINKIYKISMPGLAQNNYNDRVMIRGKQTVRHMIGQYDEKNVTINMYPIIDYLTDEEQELYLKLLSSNNIRGCVELLRKIEIRLNSEIKKTVRVHVRIVKKGK